MSSAPSPSAIVDAHVRHLRHRNRAQGTIDQRIYTLARLRRFGIDPISATTEEILRFRDRRQRDGRPLAPESQATEISHLTGWFKWLVLEGIRIDNPMDRVFRPRLPEAIPKPMTEADLARAVATAPDRVRPMYLLAAFAGLRACEIAPLRGEDIWWDAGLIFIARQKGGDEATVPLSPIVAAELRRMPAKGYLFRYTINRPGHIPAGYVSQIANDHLHSIGIWHTLHSIRHRFGTQVYRTSGRDIRAAQTLLRHKSLNSTMRYTKVDAGENAGIVANLPGLASR